MEPFLVIFLLSAVASSSVQEEHKKRVKDHKAEYEVANAGKDKNTNPTAVKAIAEGNAKFGQKWYEIVRKEEEESNLVMSPYSVSSVMAMALVGARGSTLEEMRQGMEFPEEKQLLEGYKDALGVLKGNKNFKLDTANKLFIQKGYKLLKSFMKVMKKSFYANATQTNFADSEVTRKRINDWVEIKTKEKIKDLIPKDVLDDTTRLVMVNAIYFKGNWARKFKKNDTNDGNFHVNEGKVAKAPMMHQTGNFTMRYINNLNAKAIELPYEGDRVSMYIILPNDRFGLAGVEAKLSQIKLHELFSKIDDTQQRVVYLYLPKFKLEKTFELKKHLKQMGIKQMFETENSDFSGITGSPGLVVSSVIQKAFIEVNEEGTEAAAATALIAMEICGNCGPPSFVCDHPFIFFIKDKLTDMVLFSGRVVDPTSD